jgi:Cytochrome P450
MEWILYPEGLLHLRQFGVRFSSFGLPNSFTTHAFDRHRFILRDPGVWEDPDTFRPERFLDKERLPFDPLSVVFGFGRRSAQEPVVSHVE